MQSWGQYILSLPPQGRYYLRNQAKVLFFKLFVFDNLVSSILACGVLTRWDSPEDEIPCLPSLWKPKLFATFLVKTSQQQTTFEGSHSQSIKMDSQAKFVHFSAFPKEVRDMIWKEAMPRAENGEKSTVRVRLYWSPGAASELARLQLSNSGKLYRTLLCCCDSSSYLSNMTQKLSD